MANGITWEANDRRPGYVRWDLPAAAWSGSEYHDDSIRIVCEDGKWWGITECDQCVRRDLTEAEIASVRAECDLRP